MSKPIHEIVFTCGVYRRRYFKTKNMSDHYLSALLTSSEKQISALLTSSDKQI